MKVNENGLHGLHGAGPGSLNRTDGVSAGHGSRTDPRNRIDSDQVQLSDLSQELRALSQDSPERQQRVAELRALYQSGRYEPEAAKVARSMVDDALARGPEPAEGGAKP